MVIGLWRAPERGKAGLPRLAAIAAGLSAEKVALMLAVGFVLGTFPMVGLPTILCAAAAVALRLNPAALQLVNQLSTPLQIALLFPLARAGAWLLGSSPRIGGAPFHAVAGWCCICVPLGIPLYFTLVCLLRRRRRQCFNGLEISV